MKQIFPFFLCSRHCFHLILVIRVYKFCFTKYQFYLEIKNNCSMTSAYSEILRVRYVSQTWSKAAFFNAIVFLMAIVFPYLICYRTQGKISLKDKITKYIT